MSLVITQSALNHAALVFIAGEDGLVEWSATKGREEVARYLEECADLIRRGEL